MSEMVKCTECRFCMPPKPLTPAQEERFRRERLQQEDIDISAPLPEREITCHARPPKVEIVPGPKGMISLTLWPSLLASDVNSCCAVGERKIAVVGG